MNYSALFYQLLKESANPPSKLTIKNYVSDVRHFTRWYEKAYFRKFDMVLLHPEVIKSYLNDSEGAPASKERRIAALKKFYSLYTSDGTILPNPFIEMEMSQSQPVKTDTWDIKGFKHYLYNQKASPVTVKNYLHDINSLKKWLEQAYPDSTDPRFVLSAEVLQEYKNRMIHVLMLSPRSVNRKLSSIRKYTEFANIVLGNIPSAPISSQQNQKESVSIEQITESHIPTRQYSGFLPLRIAQISWYKLADLQDAIADPIAKKIRLSESEKSPSAHKKVSNIPKAYFDPASVSTASFPIWKKAYFHTRFSRPDWYRAYHMLGFTHYLHLSILAIATIGTALYIYTVVVSPHNNQGTILGTASVNEAAVLSYRGRLTDKNKQPITSSQQVQFSIYYDSGNPQARDLWNETQTIHPDNNGIFRTTLGRSQKLPNTIFYTDRPLYLGVTIGGGDELRPRQRLVTTSNAANAGTLADMPVINQPGAGTKNVILSLDSSGNLKIGGSQNSTFQTVNGDFTLSGNTSIITTNSGTDGNIVLSPDGDGGIDIQSSIMNSADTGFVPGAVEIADTLAVITNNNIQPALVLNNEGLGGFIVASSAGKTHFVLSREGFVGIGKANPSYELDVDGNVNISGTIRLNNTTYRFPGSGGREGQLLQTDGFGNLSWISPTSIDTGPWKVDNGSIRPRVLSADFLLGGNSTSSAKFGLLGLSTSSPTATLSGNLTFSGARIINTNDMNRLQIGSATTGDITLQNNGNIGIGTSSPASALHIVKSSNEVNLTLQNTNAFSKKAQLKLSSTSPFGFWSVGTDLNNNNSDNFFIKGGTANTAALFINSQNYVGIGTTSPLFKLDIQDSQGATAAARIYNPSTSADADGLIVRLGNLSGSSVAGTNHFINFETDGVGSVGAITGNGSTGVTYATNGVADFAEYLKKDSNEDISFGSLICISSHARVSQCTTGGQVIGAASERPAFLGGKNEGDSSVAVGLVGQVEVRVTGRIQSGDLISPSSSPGVGIKARSPGYVLGRALESSETETEKKIMVLVQPTWYDPEVLFTKTGELKTRNQLNISTVNPILQDNSEFFVTDGNEVITRVSSLAFATIGSLKAGMIDAQRIFVHGSVEAREVITSQLKVTGDSFTIAGLSLRDYIRQVIEQSNDLLYIPDQPTVMASNVSTNFISPLSDSDISIDLSQDALTIRNANQASASAVARIDNEGNASFSGTLTSDTLNTSSATISGNLTTADASVSGTLTADRIVAHTIDGLEDKVATIASRIIQENDDAGNTSVPSELSLAHIPTDFIDVATVSAGFALIHDGIVSLGPGTFRELTVTDTFSLGANFIFSAGSINTLGTDLEIQPLKQGNVSIMAGALQIDTEGNLTINGDAEFRKNISVHGIFAANIITPLDNQHLDIQLPNNGTQPQEFRVVDDSKTAVFRVNDSGDVVSSGSALFARDIVASGAALLSKLNILAQPVEAVSDTETIASGSAGLATLKMHKRQITVYTPAVTAESLIYITPIGNTNNQVLYLERQIPGESFTVGISESARTDIKFNWMIVN